jgi:hypothetical protein
MPRSDAKFKLEAVSSYIVRHTLGWEREAQIAMVCTWCLRSCLHRPLSERDSCLVGCVDPLACGTQAYSLLDSTTSAFRLYLEQLDGPSRTVSNQMVHDADAHARNMHRVGGLPRNIQRTLTLVILVCAIMCGFVTFGVIDRNFGRLL